MKIIITQSLEIPNFDEVKDAANNYIESSLDYEVEQSTVNGFIAGANWMLSQITQNKNV